jgi:sarcosine oxidase subunit delta
MLLIRCPYCRMNRPEIEFRHGGEAHIARAADPSTKTDAEWADFLYMRSNPKGVIAERWRHVHGCGRFFNALRDTVSDRMLVTYGAGKPRPNDGSAQSTADDHSRGTFAPGAEGPR